MTATLPRSALPCLFLLAACSTADPPGGADAQGQPDAVPGFPDAANVAGDAAGVPDAMVLPPDAMSVPDAMALPDAMTMPDAMPADAMAPDAMSCPTDPCDLVEQCGCDTGEACDLDFADPLSGNACRAINAPGDEETACDVAAECDAGFTCVGGANDSSCKIYCDDDTQCNEPRGMCVIQLTSGGTPIPGATVCSSGCDPTDASLGGCPSGFGCGLFVVDPDDMVAGDEIDIVDCRLPGAGTQFDLCLDSGDCAPDHQCFDTGLLFNECLRLCDTVGAVCADEPGTDCIGFDPAFDVGGTEYGVCL